MNALIGVGGALCELYFHTFGHLYDFVFGLNTAIDEKVTKLDFVFTYLVFDRFFFWRRMPSTN